jgi:hypothetical protein
LDHGANAGEYHRHKRVWYAETCCHIGVYQAPLAIIGYIEPHRIVQTSAPPDPLLYDSDVRVFVLDGAICYRRLTTLKNGRGGWHWAIETLCH